jgi:hypothetical protein
MSHISKVELQIQDLTALKDACRRLKLEFCENQTSHVVYGSVPGSCNHAIKVPGATYEIGVVKSGKSYELQWDNYHKGNLEKILGKGAGLLKQAYAVSKSVLEAKKKGYMVQEKKTENGIRLVLTGGK